VISTPGTVDELMPPAQGGSWTGPILTEAHPAFGIIARNLPRVDGLLAHAAAVRAIAGRIPDLLRLDLGVVLVGGWKKLAELRSYTDAKKYGPEETVVVEITRHVITSVHKPTLDVIVNSVKVDTVPFELKLTVTLDGALLTIRAGKIYSVSPGACKGSFELKCEGFSLLKQDPAPLRLPGSWTFKEPVQIPGGDLSHTPPPPDESGPTGARPQ
jgi:hypothetical protein